jgi:4-amino-4-deoxy-L-arabinose transferase-like glycosyltransferase
MRKMQQTIRLDVVLVGALTAIGLALRIPGFHEGLWSDELLAYGHTEHTFRGMLDALASGRENSLGFGKENSPPLYFTLAWFSRKLGGDPALTRLPSLVLGTASIPLVALAGRRTVGRWPGVAGAAFMAVSPPAVYFSVEGRPYATLMFAALLSVLLLLVALERDATGWWVAYGLSLAAVVYSHYTGVFVVAAQLAWALWNTRSAPRGVLIAAASAALAFAPWLPFVNGAELEVYGAVATFLGLTRTDALATWLTGLPYEHPRAMPGALSLALLGAAVMIGVAGVVFSRPRDRSLTARTWLIGLLAVATPVGIFVYSVLGADLFVFARNLLASLPFAALAIGWLLTRLPWPAAVPALLMAALALVIGAGRTLSDSHSRPDYPQLAHYVDAVAGPRDVVVYLDALKAARGHAYAMSLYSERPHPLASQPVARDWVRELRGRHVVVVALGAIGGTPRALPPAHRLTKIAERVFPGIWPLTAAVYRADPLHGDHSYSLRDDRLVPAQGPSLPVRRSGVEGLIEPVKAVGRRAYLYSGWAHHGLQPVDKIVVFVGRSVVHADAPAIRRPDIAGNPYGGTALGFQLRVSLRKLEHSSQIVAYALWNGVAYRLGYRCVAGRHQPIPCPPDAIRD